MNTIIKNPFERKQKGTVSALCIVCLFLAGSFYSCEKRAEFSDTTQNVTGNVIGSYYYDGTASLLVQVDRKYQIGKTLEYVKGSTYCMSCTELPKNGTYQNVIQVQPFPNLPLSEFPETGIINKRISFSYREYQHMEEGEENGDHLLFIIKWVASNGLCTFPDVPMYVITDCKIIN